MRIRHMGAIALSLASAHAADGIYAKGRLNHSKAHEAYLEADWKPLTRSLEKFLAESGKRSDRVDSAFAYKYLGVIYAANPETRPRGEARFRKLLALNPSVDTADFHPLYVSAEVMALFRRLREEYPRSVDENLARAALSPDSGTGTAEPTGSLDGSAAGNPASGAKEKRPGGRRKWLFVGAAGAAVAGGVGTYLFLSRSDPSQGDATRIPIDL